MYFLDLFAGIGGFRLGLEQAGHICVGFCEIDRFARNSYQAIFDTGGEVEFHDIREISNKSFRKLRGKIDCICGGFPCQAFSLAGRRLGFEDTRGTLFFEIARATQQIQPVFFYCLKTLRAYSIMTKGGRSELYSPRLMNWGMMLNGKYLTANILVSLNTGKESILLDILEEEVDSSFFLSDEKVNRLIYQVQLV